MSVSTFTRCGGSADCPMQPGLYDALWRPGGRVSLSNHVTPHLRSLASDIATGYIWEMAGISQRAEEA